MNFRFDAINFLFNFKLIEKKVFEFANFSGNIVL